MKAFSDITEADEADMTAEELEVSRQDRIAH
jgi:hypothetical protein